MQYYVHSKWANNPELLTSQLRTYNLVMGRQNRFQHVAYHGGVDENLGWRGIEIVAYDRGHAASSGDEEAMIVDLTGQGRILIILTCASYDKMHDIRSQKSRHLEYQKSSP